MHLQNLRTAGSCRSETTARVLAPAGPTHASSDRRRGVVRLGLLLVLTTLVSAASILPATAASAKPSRIAFGVGPASASGPDGRSSFDYSATPGATLFDHVAVINYSTRPATLQLYATDA